ncbi:helix-turn-helix domain-containing protein [Marinomonas colpomeniae]|uniref:Helix-turn-helix transcriptional regulator n=1 Tax=Marinomonas colpomeniae TaxID=2774408 RepID=A0ABR8NXL4_9GAMM|nr:helix-turn-helix transcriptional regulator [Marinomonas colpomeniae]MBD5770789.1 helix-turn-helix transcriptional regulator [Marinomonas colpomeniae]
MKIEMTEDQRQALLIDLLRQHILGEISQGELLKYLRKNILGVSQTRYAEFIGVSRRTLTDIEQNKGSQAQGIIDKVFKPFGIKSSLAPIQPHMACYLLVGKSGQ